MLRKFKVKEKKKYLILRKKYYNVEANMEQTASEVIEIEQRLVGRVNSLQLTTRNIAITIQRRRRRKAHGGVSGERGGQNRAVGSVQGCTELREDEPVRWQSESLLHHLRFHLLVKELGRKGRQKANPNRARRLRSLGFGLVRFVFDPIH